MTSMSGGVAVCPDCVDEADERNRRFMEDFVETTILSNL